jgi:hypothetical protein
MVKLKNPNRLQKWELSMLRSKVTERTRICTSPYKYRRTLPRWNLLISKSAQKKRMSKYSQTRKAWTLRSTISSLTNLKWVNSNMIFIEEKTPLNIFTSTMPSISRLEKCQSLEYLPLQPSIFVELNDYWWII